MSNELPINSGVKEDNRPSNDFEEDTKRKNKAQKKLERVIKDHNLTKKQVDKYFTNGWKEYHGTPHGSRFYTDPKGYTSDGLQVGYLTALTCQHLIDDIESKRVKEFLNS